MLSKDEIRAALNKTAKQVNIEGDVKDAIVGLLTEAIYMDTYTSLNLSLEASPDTCTEINSAIMHSRDRMYSVNRGSNQRIKVKNIYPIEARTYNKYDTAFKLNGFYFLFSESGGLNPNAATPEIEFIISKKEVQVADLTADSTNYTYMDCNSIDISEDVVVQVDEISNVKYSRIFSESVADKDTLMLLTNLDYSVSLLNPRGFPKDESRYSIKYVEYTDEMVNIDDIDSLPGFNYDKGRDYESQETLVVYVKNNEFYSDDSCTIHIDRPENFDDYKLEISTPDIYEFIAYIASVDSSTGAVTYDTRYYLYTYDKSTFKTNTYHTQIDTRPDMRSLTDFNIYQGNVGSIQQTTTVFHGTSTYSYTHTKIDHDDSNATKLESISPVLRESNIKSIINNAHVAYISNNMIRSKYDLENLFINYFGDTRIFAVKVISTEDNATIYYIGSPIINKTTEWINFLEEIQKSYYIPNLILSISPALHTDKLYKINIYCKVQPDSGQISETIQNAFYQIGGSFSIYKILSNLSKITNVEYTELGAGSASDASLDLGEVNHFGGQVDYTLIFI